jgi:hypothetical protein
VHQSDDEEDIFFRYALTLWMQGKEEGARFYLTKSFEQNYSPSHELYLLRKQIPAGFQEAMEASSRKNQQRVTSAPCPPS